MASRPGATLGLYSQLLGEPKRSPSFSGDWLRFFERQSLGPRPNRDQNLPLTAYVYWYGMTPSQTISISQVAELLAHSGYDFAEQSPGVLRVRDIHSGVSFQAALQGNVLYFTVHLVTLSPSEVNAGLMRKMLSGDNGISTSSFRLFEGEGGKVLVTLNNFCTLQDMGPEDRGDILSCASFLMADVVAARDLLQPTAAAA